MGSQPDLHQQLGNSPGPPPLMQYCRNCGYVRTPTTFAFCPICGLGSGTESEYSSVGTPVIGGGSPSYGRQSPSQHQQKPPYRGHMGSLILLLLLPQHPHQQHPQRALLSMRVQKFTTFHRPCWAQDTRNQTRPMTTSVSPLTPHPTATMGRLLVSRCGVLRTAARRYCAVLLGN